MGEKGGRVPKTGGRGGCEKRGRYFWGGGRR